jgi:hypothetical protein
MSFENMHTKQRQADVPTEPARQKENYLNISASSLATSATTSGM